MIRKKRMLLALAREVVAIYGGKATQPVEALVATETEAHLPGPVQSRQLTVGETYDGRRVVSLLRLRGRWLEHAGFPAGARVVVQVQEGRIVLLRCGDSEHEND